MDTKCILLLFAAILRKVTSAPESVYALEGNSITLTMKRHYLDPDDVSWTFNETYNVVKYYPNSNKSPKLVFPDSYKGRVEFDNTTFSLELRNLQKNDSGLYKGEIATEEENKTVVEYRLSIFEQISAPNLTVEPVLSSGDLCNVTCRAGDLSLTSICNSSTCTQNELTGSSSLAIFIRDGVIICNHSNPLNWSHATATLCQHTKDDHIGNTVPQKWKLIIIAGGLALGGLFICGVLYFRMHVTNKGSLSSHIYQSVEVLSASPDVKRPNLTKSQCSSSHAEIGPSQNALWLNSVESPPCTYYQIQPHTGPNTDVETTQLGHVYSLMP